MLTKKRYLKVSILPLLTIHLLGSTPAAQASAPACEPAPLITRYLIPPTEVSAILFAYQKSEPKINSSISPANIFSLMAAHFPASDLTYGGLDPRIAFASLESGLATMLSTAGKNPAITPPLTDSTLNELRAIFARAYKLSKALTTCPTHNDLQILVQQSIVEPLKSGQLVAFEGGYLTEGKGHFIAVIITPPSAETGESLVGIFNRGEGLTKYHTQDGEKRFQPMFLRVPAETLFAPGGNALLADILALKRGNHSIDDFYLKIAQLISPEMGGELLLGKLANETAQKLAYPGQSPQKGITCTMHSNFAMLQFLLYYYRRAISLDPARPGVNEDRYTLARSDYKWLRAMLRRAIIQETLNLSKSFKADYTDMLKEMLNLSKSFKAVYTDMLNKQLNRISTWLADKERNNKPYRSIELQLLASIQGKELQEQLSALHKTAPVDLGGFAEPEKPRDINNPNSMIDAQVYNPYYRFHTYQLKQLPGYSINSGYGKKGHFAFCVNKLADWKTFSYNRPETNAFIELFVQRLQAEHTLGKQYEALKRLLKHPAAKHLDQPSLQLELTLRQEQLKAMSVYNLTRLGHWYGILYPGAVQLSPAEKAKEAEAQVIRRNIMKLEAKRIHALHRALESMKRNHLTLAQFHIDEAREAQAQAEKLPYYKDYSDSHTTP